LAEILPRRRLPVRRAALSGMKERKLMMENLWLTSAVWMGLALVSALISIRLALSVAR
jgi:hypothetical protein